MNNTCITLYFISYIYLSWINFWSNIALHWIVSQENIEKPFAFFVCTETLMLNYF